MEKLLFYEKPSVGGKPLLGENLRGVVENIIWPLFIYRLTDKVIWPLRDNWLVFLGRVILLVRHLIIMRWVM